MDGRRGFDIKTFGFAMKLLYCIVIPSFALKYALILWFILKVRDNNIFGIKLFIPSSE